MKMWDLLQERVSPSRLYHWTTLDALAQILKSNKLEARAGEGAGKVSFNKEPGVSFSRDPLATGIADTKPTVLVLDRNRVAHNHKLVPRYGDIQKAADYAAASGGEYEPVRVRRETEEKVMGDVEPLDRYLTHIVMSVQWFDWLVQGYILKQLKRHQNFWPSHAIGMMEWLVAHPHVGVLVTDDLQAAWTRALDTHSVYPGQFEMSDWERLWKESEDRRLKR